MRIISVRLPTRLLIALIYLMLVRILKSFLMIIAHRRSLLTCYLSLIINVCAKAQCSLGCFPLRLRKLFVRTYAYLFCAF